MLHHTWNTFKTWIRFQEVTVVKIQLLGLSDCGKTSILYSSVGRKFSSAAAWCGKRGFLLHSTIGFNSETLPDGTLINDWGFGGQGVLFFQRVINAGEGTCVAFVVDAAGIDRLAEAKEFYLAVQNHCLHYKIPFCIMANKQDLSQPLSGAKISKMFRNSQLLRSDVNFVASSKLLWLAAFRNHLPRDLRQLLLRTLAGCCDDIPKVFETCAPEVRMSTHAFGIREALDWLGCQIRKRK